MVVSDAAPRLVIPGTYARNCVNAVLCVPWTISPQTVIRSHEEVIFNGWRGTRGGRRSRLRRADTGPAPRYVSCRRLHRLSGCSRTDSSNEAVPRVLGSPHARTERLGFASRFAQ